MEKNRVPAIASIKRQEGVSAIEFALILPLMLLIAYGIVCYALILLDKQSLSSISAAAAVNTASTKDSSQIASRIQQAIDDHPWITDRIVPCEGSTNFYQLLPSGQLRVCVQANPIPMPVINLGVFQLPPANQASLLRSTATVLWAP